MTDIIKEEVEEEPEINNVIIFNDMTAYLRNNQIKQLLKELVFNRRHYHTSIYFLVQTYKSLEPSIRKLFTNLFIFKVSKNEMETIINEKIDVHKDNINEIIKLYLMKNIIFYLLIPTVINSLKIGMK